MRYVLLLPVALVLTSCGANNIMRAMDENLCAIQRSTQAIEQNIDALNRVTEHLHTIQQES